ncbi:MAG: FAD:protein FMN transferase, partial [Candidatus Neomarinimicrobiota bacterium]
AYAASADGLGWEHILTHPGTGEELATLYLENCGLATASIRDQAYTYRNTLYYNHLDPRTGYLADSLLSVTIVAPSTELAAALARGIFPLSPVRGLRLLNELPGVEGLLLDSEGQVHRSDSLQIWMGG